MHGAGGVLVALSAGNQMSLSGLAMNPRPRGSRGGLIATFRIACLLVAGWMLLGAPVAAQTEIVVTGARYDPYQELMPPHVTLMRRADYALVTLEVRSDTRDLSQRLSEMRNALAGLEGRARGGSVTLALIDGDTEQLRPFSVAAAQELIVNGQRPETSRVTISLRTPVAAGDTLDAIHDRFTRFVAAAPKPGRIEMETHGLDLTLVDPEQYRSALIAEIGADGRRLSESLGDAYGVRIGAMEQRVVWRRVGDLDLTLFIPYTMELAPR